MVNSLAAIQDNLLHFEELSPYEFKPFWDIPAFSDATYWGEPSVEAPPSLFVSGPSRNGNHLVHSMLDSHPELPLAPGEDSFLAAFFEDARHNVDNARSKLTGPDNVDYILELSGYGTNKWKQLAEGAATGDTKTTIWSGIQEKQAFVADYQDTFVEVDYEAYVSRLCELAETISKAPTFIDVLWLYLDAFNRLTRPDQKRQYEYLMVASGMRAESWYVLNRTSNTKCVVPLRPFGTYYRSFAKGRLGSSEVVNQDILKEAWEHWIHKAVDYLLLKRHFPDRICLVNFEHLISETDAAATQLCNFLKIEDAPSCRIPTVLGTPTKGNSSFPKQESKRGSIYTDGLSDGLPEEFWPPLAAPTWEMIKALSI